MEIRDITVLAGRGKSGAQEPVPVVRFAMGEVVSIVGPTGSGKTCLINDIALFASRNTPSMRQVLVNGAPPQAEFLEDASKNPIALITQHTSFLSDLPVRRFIETHARVRKHPNPGAAVDETLSFADQLTGEAIIVDSAI
jgi:ABC-type lipoprotein export system ATPase subunit